MSLKIGFFIRKLHLSYKDMRRLYILKAAFLGRNEYFKPKNKEYFAIILFIICDLEQPSKFI
jgi:hypothetical protein